MKDVAMKSQCGFCKSESVETALEDGNIILMCSVCGMESFVEYPESINYFHSEINDEYAISDRNTVIRFHV